MEYYSAVKKSGVLSFAGKWMELKIIVLNEISQAHKAQCRMFSLICGTHADDDDGTRMSREDCLGLISRRWRKEKDTPCIYMKTVQCHPTQFGKHEKAERESNRGVNLSKVHYARVWNYHSETPSYD
jgi:hypothetical protein